MQHRVLTDPFMHPAMERKKETLDPVAVNDGRDPRDGDEIGEEFHELVVDGVLDLHMFRPGDIKLLIPDYLEECREKGILSVRIIHGKGTGTLRRTVHSILERLPWVVSFGLASEWEGGWGATVVILKP